MKGRRPLNNDEIQLVSDCFTGTFEIRNRSLFMIGVSTGGRISELLSLTIGDVYQNGRAVSDLLYSKSIMPRRVKPSNRSHWDLNLTEARFAIAITISTNPFFLTINNR